jgi:hypothetical protein
MKKGLKRISLALLMLIMAVSMLTGCGPKKPTAEDAQAYVQAVLDLMCTGDYDHSVKLADVEEGKETEIRDNLVNQMIAEFSTEANLSEDTAKAFSDFMIKALEKASFTVGDAVETDDGGYDVTVSVEPLQIYTGVEDELKAVLEVEVAAEPDKILAMSEEEQTDFIMGILIQLLNKKLEDPKYDPAEEVTVHYGPMEGEDGVYGCTAAEGEKLGEKLFSASGL